MKKARENISSSLKERACVCARAVIDKHGLSVQIRHGIQRDSILGKSTNLCYVSMGERGGNLQV